MVSCAVSSCKNRSTKTNMRNDGVTYHMFPKDPLWKDQWITFCKNNPGWEASPTSKICSDHFSSSSWVPLSSKRRRLVDGAIPTIYSKDAKTGGKKKKVQKNGRIIIGPGEIPTASQIESLINVHPIIRTLKRKLHMKIKKIRSLQGQVAYAQQKFIVTKQKLKELEVQCSKYREKWLKLKSNDSSAVRFSMNQLIPSVNKALLLKRALFKTK